MTPEKTIKGLTLNYNPNELTSAGLIKETEEERLDRALALMEWRNPSLGNLVETKEEESFFGVYEARTIVKKVGTDFETNQPVYSIKFHEIPLLDFSGTIDIDSENLIPTHDIGYVHK